MTEAGGPEGPRTSTDSQLSGAEVRRRASAGLLYIASSSTILLVTGLVGNLVLARLLTPEDFGVVALGLTVILLASTVGDGGLVAGLVRRKEDPTQAELRTLVGVQLVGTSAVALVAAAVALQFGRTGAIAAVMLVSLPISALQGTGRVVVTRKLLFSRISLVDVTATVAFYAWAIPAAIAGMGAWAMATGVVVRSATSALMFLAVGGVGWIRPSLKGFSGMLPTLRFGVAFQVAWISHVVREQTLNAGAGVILGVGPLGVWALAIRLLQLPMVLFQSVWHVSFPAMSHVIAAERDPRPIVERTARIGAVVSVLVLAPFAAAAPGLVPSVFGEQWRETGRVLPLCCLGLLLLGPMAAAAHGYLYAEGKPRDVVRAIVVAAVVTIPTSFALMPVLGAAALGIGAIVNAVAESIVLDAAVRRACGARLLAQMAVPVLIGAGAGAVGAAVAFAGGATLTSGLLGSVTALVAAILGLAVANREELVASIQVAREAVANVRSAA